MVDEFKTIQEHSESEYKDRGSKFLGYAFPVKSIEEVEHFIQEVKSNHLKARHYCYAYKIGLNEDTFRYNDDGEPSGTAGKPIFGQILSYELTDVLIIVVRYFGGTKLGASGLINAYKEAAKSALDQAIIVTKYISDCYRLTFEYDHMGTILNVLKTLEFNIINKSFTTLAEVDIEIRRSNVIQQLTLLKSRLLNVSPEYINEETEVPYCKIEFLSTHD